MGSQFSLHIDFRTMNEHLRNVHDPHVGFNRDQFKELQTVEGTKTGPKRSYVAVPVVRAPDDFRTESVFEGKVGLLKSCFYHTGEEQSLVEEKAVWWTGKGKDNPYFNQVLAILNAARDMCDRPGSTHVRQHAVRDAGNAISPKVFLPVQKRAASYYAKSVAHFIYFCSKVKWDGRPDHDLSASAILKSVLFEKHKRITQTFITR